MPSITSIKKERAERLFRWKQEGVKAVSFPKIPSGVDLHDRAESSHGCGR